MQSPVATSTSLTSEGVVTMNYQIPDELHYRLKVLAAQKATTLKSVVLEALEQYADRADTTERKGNRS